MRQCGDRDHLVEAAELGLSKRYTFDAIVAMVENSNLHLTLTDFLNN